MANRLADLVALTESGRPLEEVLDGLASPAERDALDRCAALNVFDRGAFEVACADLGPQAGAEFDTVVAHPDIEAVDDGHYRMRRAARRRRLDAWLSRTTLNATPVVPPWMRDLGVRMVAHFESQAARNDAEAMYHAFAVDPSQATDRLRKLFATADEAFDLPRCRYLVDLAEDRVPLGGPSLAQALNGLRAHLAARTQWSQEWYRTTSFIPPAASRAAADALLAPDGPTVLDIVGEDGLGKTTHLQWLIARRCVPERYACARLDLVDASDPLLLTNEPWLLLLEIARQLDPQLPESPFHELLLDHAGHCARLFWTMTGPRPAALPTRPPEHGDARRRLASEVRERFYDALRVGAPAHGVLVAVDSLEAALPGHTSRERDLRSTEVVRELAELVRRVPGTRFAIASRPTTTEWAPVMSDVAESRVLRLSRLTPTDARALLLDGWRLHLDYELEESAIHAGMGIPLRLAVLGDAMRRRAVSAREVAAAGRNKRGLIKLVADDVPPALRAALRFGAAPDLLDRAFFDSVLVPFAAENCPDAIDEGTDKRALWRLLRDFSAASPWIELAGADAVRFHRTFKQPMRDLLRETPEWESLNKAAEAFFAQRGDEEPHRWGGWMSEALFHRHQWDAASAVTFWRELMRRSDHREAQHADRLAYELLRFPDTHPGGDTSTENVVVEAWLERARANVRLARETPGASRGHEGWERAEVALSEARISQDETGAGPLPMTAAGLQAALLARDGREVAAAELLRDVLRGPAPVGARLVLRVELARVLEVSAPAEAIREYRESRRLAARLAEARPDPVMIERRLARHLVERDRYEGARRHCDGTLECVGQASPTYADLVLLRAEISSRAGAQFAAGASAASLGALNKFGGRVSHRAGVLEARAALAAWRPEDALQLLDEMYERAGADDRNADAAELALRTAEIRELRGHSRLRLLDTTAGLDDVDAALHTFSALGLTTRMHNSLARMAELQLRYLDDLRAAGLTLDRADLAAEPTEPLASSLVRLRRVEWLDRTHSAAGVHRELGAIIADLRAAQAPPRFLVAAAIEGLALRSDPDPLRYLDLLSREIASVEGVGARLVMIEDLRRCPQLTDVDAGIARRLDRLTYSRAGAGTRAPGLQERDRGILLLAHADLARVCGRAQAARRRLMAARAAIAPDGPGSYAWRESLDALERFGETAAATEAAHVVADAPENGPLPAIRDSWPSNAASIIKGAWSLLRSEDVNLTEAHALRDMADRLLRQRQVQGNWLATLHKVREDLARRLGDERGARSHQGHAAVLQQRLTEQEDDPAAANPQVLGTAHTPLRLELRRRSNGLGVRVGDGEHTTERIVAGPIGRMLAKPDRAEVEDLIRWVASNPAHWGAEAAAAVLGRDALGALARTDGGQLTLCFTSRDRRVHALPWELVLLQAPAPVRERFTDVERSAPGVLAVPHEESPPGLKNVTVFRPAPAATPHRDGASRRTATVRIENRYSTYGWNVHVEDSFRPAALESTVTDNSPSVIHLACSLVLSGGIAMLDISADGRPPRGWTPEETLLEAGRLARTTASVGGVPTIFILDPPGVAGEIETTRQLFLRNAFASELLMLGSRPVLCTGLLRYGDRDRTAAELVDSLSSSQRLSTIATRLRDRLVDTDRELLAASTALFTPSALPPPGDAP